MITRSRIEEISRILRNGGYIQLASRGNHVIDSEGKTVMNLTDFERRDVVSELHLKRNEDKATWTF